MSKARNVESVYPLTPLQEGMVFQALKTPEAGLYVEQLLCSASGPIDPRALEEAWRWVVDRHAVLRTAFAWKRSDRMLQVVHRRVEVAVQLEDLRGLPDVEREAAVQAAVARERARGFDLARAPLARLSLLRMAAEDWRLLFTQHHAVLDGWSTALVFADLLGAYEALSTGRRPEAGPVRPYREFVAWLQRRDARADEAFWRGELAGFREPTPLVVERARARPGAATPSPRACERVTLGPDETRAVELLARSQRVTVGTVLQGAWALLLSRYGGEEDVLFGVTVSGRPADLPGADAMVGLLVNTLPFRVAVADEAQVGSWLARLQARQLELRQHEHTPLVTLRGCSEVPHDRPLLTSLFVLENYPVDASLRRGGGSVRVVPLRGYGRTELPLAFVATPGEQLRLEIAYDEERFDQGTIARMLGHVRELLRRMAARPGARLGDLELLGEEERRRVVVEWNATRAPEPSAAGAHRLFEEQARRTPGAAALAAGAEELTYAALNARANRIARRLAAMGVRREALVGILLEPSFDLVATILGVLKAGGAWLPLDPAYPRERLSYMLEDSAAPLVVTSTTVRDRLPEGRASALCLDAPEEASALAASSDEDLGVQVGPRDLAYVIYTSGSTGRPKGVQVEHRGLCNFAEALTPLLELGPGRRMLQFASSSFDAAVSEVFGALASGATLHLAPRERLASVDGLARLLRDERIGVVTLPPSLLALLPADAFPELRTVVSAGEACPVEVAARWSRGRRFLNGYGPTEATVAASFEVVREVPEGAARVPIGRPIANVRTYVLDRRLRPVPVGVPGELCVGGVGVARGYLGRPDLTAERFVPDPFADEPGARMYRTGDLATWRPDGTLEFLGRRDGQVKVRGYRVELGEIEAALSRHPAIAQAAVAVRGQGAEARLVAFVVPRERGGPAPELRGWLRERLPEHMVPGAYLTLDGLPLGPNGKVDRARLPDPEVAGAPERTYAAPRGPVEEILAGLVGHVLGLERVGREDDFFALGGHSLKATQLASRVREALGVELSLRELFENTTVATLADRVEAARSRGRPELPPVLPAPPGAERLPSFAQQRLWFLEQLEPGTARYTIPVALRLAGRLDVAALARSVAEIVRRHAALRSTFAAEEGRPIQVVAPSVRVDLEVEDLGDTPAAAREARVREIAASEANRSFDLQRGPLVRARVLRVAPDDHVALFTMHHIVSDGWSVGVLVRELSALYAAFAEGRPSPLPELPVQYADYAHWQRNWLAGPRLDAELAYWKERLAGVPPLLQLPTDRPRPPVPSGRGATLTFDLDPALSAEVVRVGRRYGATPFMTLLAAFQALLHRYSGERDVCVGTPVANRARSELEGLIGFFVNTLVIRGDLSGDPTFQEVLARVRDSALGAYAHQDVPFEAVVEATTARRALGYGPLFQVMFVLDEDGDRALELPGLRVEPLEVDRRASTFDLTLSMARASDRLRGAFEYSTDLFDASTVARMATHLAKLLQGVVADPARRISDVPLLDDAESRRLLVEWNDTAAEVEDACFHQRFERWAERTPDAAALTFEDVTWSYRELDRRADAVADALARAGVAPGALVAVCAERSPEMVAAVLGVQKAGAAYVPLDPAYPEQRLAYMLEDCGAGVLLVQDRVLDRVSVRRARTVSLDAACAAREVASSARPAPGPESLAYVIYTSGSTGKPKGVQLAHRGLTNLSEAQRRLFGVGPGSRVLQFSPFSFDASVWEMAMALGNGGTLCLARQETLASGAELLRLLRERAITAVTLPPSVLKVLEPGELPALALVVSAGEACPRELVERWAPGRSFWNAYGPTETTVCATMGRCDPGDPRAPSIGRPLPNMRAYVLDEELRPVPTGLPGELCVGGVGLARGYLGQPDLTSRKFLPDPFVPGARLYRTGDLARFRGDGTIEYLGRKDEQVKVRGFRIEPGEVEQALRREPGVKDCVVVAREDRPGDARLVAYVAHGGEPAPKAAQLRAALRAQLPEHLVPSSFVALAELPLSPTGKVDRRALPAPDAGRADSDRPYVAPRTPTEEALAAATAELLGVEQVGVEDDFFELGGHSLLATQLLSRVRGLFGVEIPLRTLFEEASVACLARAIDAAKASQQDAAAEIDRLLQAVELLSPDQVRALLEARGGAGVDGGQRSGAGTAEDAVPLATGDGAPEGETP